MRTTPVGVVSPARPAAAPLLGHSSRPLEPEIASTRSLMLATAQRCELISELLGLPRSFDRQFVRNVLERFSPQHRGPAAEPAWNRLGYVLSQAFHCRMLAADRGATLRSRFVRGGIAHLHAGRKRCQERMALSCRNERAD